MKKINKSLFIIGMIVITVFFTVSIAGCSSVSEFWDPLIEGEEKRLVVSSLTGNQKVYADNGTPATYDQAMLEPNVPFSNAGGPGGEAPDKIVLVQMEGGVGEAGSFYRVDLTGGDAPWAVFGWTISTPYDASANTNSVLRFSVRSTVASFIQVRLETAGAAAATPSAGGMGIPASFTADGQWQEIAYSLNTGTFTDGVDVLSSIINIVFFLTDATGNNPVPSGLGVQTLDIDEIRFEVGGAPVVNFLTGSGKIYADSGERATLSQIPITENSPNRVTLPIELTTNVMTNATNVVTNTTIITHIALTETGGVGASSYRVNLVNGEVTNASFSWEFSKNYNATAGVSSLKFYIRSTNANVTNIGVRLERQGDGADGTSTVEMPFTANGSWQEITYPLDTNTFTNSIATNVLPDIYKVVFVLSDANGTTAGLGEQIFEIDEIYFDGQ